METVKPDELIHAFLEGEKDMRTGTRQKPGPLRIMNDKLICFETVICERYGDKYIINKQFYSRQTAIAQDMLVKLIPKEKALLVSDVPFVYWGSLAEYLPEKK